MDPHDSAVLTIAARVKQFADQRRPFRIYHGSTNSTRESQYHPDNVIDTSSLNHVLKVNTRDKTILAEPNVAMDYLVKEAMRHGLIPPVVMEFPGITVGGGFAGTAGESSSFRYGFFDRTINWIEIVLADGNIVTASPTSNSDLFRGAAASFGTLGITTLLEVQLIEAKPFVQLTYQPVANVSEAIRIFREAENDSTVDYVDGILFAADKGVVCSGRLQSTVPKDAKIQQFSRATDPWFYLHAQKLLRKNEGSKTEFVPLADYLFRYDRGGFWVGAYAFKYFLTPFNRVTRWLLDGFMHTRVMYHALHQSGHSKQYIIQDVAVPYKAAEEFVSYLEASFGHYPLWLCPLRQVGTAGHSPGCFSLAQEYNASNAESGMLLNFGIWGPGPRGRRQFVKANRKLEQKVQALEGRKWLYAHAYYTEEEFWRIYDRKVYEKLREKYNATYLPSIYDKVKVDVDAEEALHRESWQAWLICLFWSIWPLSGLYGVFKAALGGDYLLPRQYVVTKKRDE